MSITRQIKPFTLTLSQKFHDKTKAQSSSKQFPSSDEWPESWKKVYFKGYPRFKAIKLPTESLTDRISFKEIMFRRKSHRKYSGLQVTKQELGNLLYFSAGIRKKNETMTANRFYPSAGARYPLEVYPIIYDVGGIKSGIYHYYLKSHLLEILPKKKNYRALSYKFFGDQGWVKNANLLLIISAVPYRNQVKYGERGYRHILTELGSMIQNIYLTCAAINLGCCPTGGYIDDGYNSLLDLDGVEESTIACIAIGRI